MARVVRDHGIVLAIDASKRDSVLELAAKIGPLVDGIKLGVPALLTNGGSIVREVAESCSGPVLADLKVADIGFREGKTGNVWSGTNKAIVEAAVGAGIDYIICHTIVGTSSILECVETAHSLGGKVLTLPYMTHEGASLFFDIPLDMKHASGQLLSAGMVLADENLIRLEHRKSTEAGWRTRSVTVSDLVLLLGEAAGVDGYIAPANRPEVMKDFRKMTQREIMATGVGRQGGTIRDVFTILGSKSAAIAGHAIYAAPDPVGACRTLLADRDALIAGRVA